METLKKYMKFSNTFFVYGHRGVPSLISDNTLQSFEKAIELGYDGVELDVQITSDNQIIVFHDSTHPQLNKPIIECTYKQICDIDIILEKKPPLLSEILSKLGHKTVINIEVKDQGIISFQVIKKIIQQIKEFNILDSVIISSFNPQIIKESKKIDNRIDTAWILGSKNFKFFSLWNITLRYFNPDYLHINYKILSKTMITKIKLKKRLVFAYTINDKKILQKLIHQGVNGVFTDYPKIMEKGKHLNQTQN